MASDWNEGRTSVVELQKGDVLLIVDVQKDFLPGGSLAVPRGDEVVPILNRYLEYFVSRQLPIVATRDWHPADHCSFVERGGPWPPHCIAETEGASLAPDLALPPDATIISKAQQSDRDAYSGFDHTELAACLHKQGARRLYIGGLATAYCVLNTVRDALAEGFLVMLLRDAIRAVDVHEGDGRRAVQEMERAGARPISLAALKGQRPCIPE